MVAPTRVLVCIKILYCFQPPQIALSFLMHCNNINFFFRNKITLVSLIPCLCVSNHIGMCVARVCLLSRKRADEGVLHRTKALSQAHPSLMLPLNPIFVFTSRASSIASSSIVSTVALLSVLMSASSSALSSQLSSSALSPIVCVVKLLSLLWRCCLRCSIIVAASPVICIVVLLSALRRCCLCRGIVVSITALLSASRRCALLCCPLSELRRRCLRLHCLSSALWHCCLR